MPQNSPASPLPWVFCFGFLQHICQHTLNLSCKFSLGQYFSGAWLTKVWKLGMILFLKKVLQDACKSKSLKGNLSPSRQRMRLLEENKSVRVKSILGLPVWDCLSSQKSHHSVNDKSERIRQWLYHTALRCKCGGLCECGQPWRRPYCPPQNYPGLRLIK